MDTVTQIAATGGPILLALMGVIVSISPPERDGKAHWLWLVGFLVLGGIATLANFSELRSSDGRLAQIAAALGLNPNTPAQKLADQITAKLVPAQIAGATTREMNGGDTYAFLEIDVNHPIDSNGTAFLMLAAKGTAAVPLVRWHVYPPGSKNDPQLTAYLNTYPTLNGIYVSLSGNGGPYAVAKVAPNKYSVDFSATNGDYMEDLNFVANDGTLRQEITVHWNGKEIHPLEDAPQQ